MKENNACKGFIPEKWEEMGRHIGAGIAECIEKFYESGGGGNKKKKNNKKCQESKSKLN